ncbi:MAG: exodeoxyribonuclease III [Candidatus Thorarchaeota archaeon]
MTELKMISWNVNGIRAVLKKDVVGNKSFLSWIASEQPDIICLQETKAHPEQLPDEISNLTGYHSYWNSGERKGYSGVVTYSKQKPIDISYNLGFEDLDNEGRLIITDYGKFILCNGYFPNGKKDDERLDYKMRFYEVFLEFIEKKRKAGKAVIFCGDVNTAHKEIDLARPKSNEEVSGFLPIERAWIDKVIGKGYIDSFRFIHGDKLDQYTWWSVRNIGARENNVGWRLDYFFVSNEFEKNIKDAYILTEVQGSDHCPVVLKLDV